ncbi:purine-binding chemotaxis protein CheW [Thalassotalea sp. LPB0316]|uniref:chemotaxis protein CheW n=1 Tax=Thalassotalea sp. LPB0316 TaxID=2769490 RepID=UPI0018681C3C|nr:chemotaxis protein CheW [Thalassotalea sp. LPB0316]QOL24772.1 purine-binding chemotaxis protein CheW [Thalassotalea sp. LPB0316]
MNLQNLINDVPVEGEYTLEGLDFITSGDQYLSFKLAEECYAVDILAVEEIRSWQEPTIIPNAPKEVIGVINMRGTIVPIVDLRIKFNVGQVSYTPTTVVIVLAIDTVDALRKVGFVVDAVEDVINAKAEEVKPYFELSGGIASRFVEGQINVNQAIVTVVNLRALHQFNDQSEVAYE